MKVKVPKHLFLFIILFGTMFLFGFIENIKGVTYPLIKTQFDVSYEQQGIMVSILSIGYVLFCLVGGILIGRLGVKKTFIMGFVFLILGLGCAFLLPPFLFVAASLFVIFSSFGLFEVSVNALASQLFVTRAALLMNLLHFFYGAGSSFSPRAAGFAASVYGWRYVYLFSIPFVVLFFISSLFARFPAAEAESQEKTEPKKTGFLTALKTPEVWIFGVVLGLMVAVELCSSNWAGLYFQDVYKLDPTTSGASFISNFYILFTISRLLSGFVIEKAGYMKSLFVSALAVVLIFAAGFLLGAKGIYVLPGLGFFTAVFWPTLLAAAMGYFKEDAPVMTSAIIVIGGSLSSFLQLFAGFFNRFIGPTWGYRSFLLHAALIIVFLFILVRQMRNPYRGRA